MTRRSQGKEKKPDLEEELGGLVGPAALGGAGAVLLGLGGAADAAAEAAEGDDLLLLHHVLQVALGPLQRHPLDRLRRLPSVLEVHPQVRPPRLARCKGKERFCIGRFERTVKGTI